MRNSGMDSIGRGNFFDTGAGGGGRYGNNENLFHSFFPVDTANRLRVKIYSFSTEVSYDYFSIYSGSGSNPPRLVSASGAGSFFTGNTYTSAAADGSLSFGFTSDGSVNDSGWRVLISSCNESRSTLIFSGKDALCRDDAVDLYAIPHCDAYNFQWQQSSDSINWTNITHFSSDSRIQERLFIASPTTSGYYRFRSQLNTFDTLYSNMVYISVDTTCYSQSGRITTVNTCGGTYYDSGQGTRNYSNNESQWKTFRPDDPNGKMLVTFTQFAIDSSDTLSVYNGSNSNAPLIGHYTGTVNIGTIASTAPDGSLTFEFVSDGANTAAGWEAQLSCYCTSAAAVAHPPVADLCASQGPVSLTGGTPAGGQYVGAGVINGTFDPNLVGAGNHALTYVYTDTNGCIGDTTFFVQVLPTPITTEVVAACDSYTWNNGITYTSTTFAADTLVSAAGCDSIATLQLTINTATAQIRLSTDTLIANSTGGTYQWIDCATNAPIAGATSPQYIPLQSGTYAVVLTQNGCTDTSNCINVTRLNSQQPMPSTTLTRVYPNPAQDVVYIELPKLYTVIEVKIAAIDGTIVFAQDYENQQQLVLPVQALHSGVYVVHLIYDQQQEVVRFIKE